jgi:hypothetical protein
VRLSFYLSVCILFLGNSMAVIGADKDEMATIQKKYNTEIMEKEFFAEQPDKVEAYIKEAMEKDLKPHEYMGSYWRVGHTCRDLLRYSWLEYRDCRYYHRYHGHYYPYP